MSLHFKRSPTNRNFSVDPNISGLSASNLLRPGTRDNLLVCWAPTRKELWSIRISGACHLMVIQGFRNIKLMLKQMSQVCSVLSCREISLKKGTLRIGALQKFCPSWIWKIQDVLSLIPGGLRLKGSYWLLYFFRFGEAASAAKKFCWKVTPPTTAAWRLSLEVV